MNQAQSWLTENQFRKIAPHLPTDTRGKERVDDRRVISGIVHVLKSGGRWVDTPPDCGPKKTLYNSFVRRATKGVWVKPFQALAQAAGPGSDRLQRGESSSLGGGWKRGRKIRRSAVRAAGARRKSTR
jgi:transposase